MDAAQNVQGQQQQQKQEAQHSKKFEKRPDPLAHVASRITALSKSAEALPLWAMLKKEIVTNDFRLPSRELYSFAQNCPAPVNGERNLRAELVEQYRDVKVLKGLTTENVGEESQVRRFATLLQLANFVDAVSYLKERATVIAAFKLATKPVPADLKERIAKCDHFNREGRGGYTAEDYLKAGYELKSDNGDQRVLAHPLSSESVTVYPKREDFTPKSRDNGRRARSHGASHEERARNEMLSAFEPERRPAKKHHKIPEQTPEQMEANRRAKVEGRLARRAAAHKAAAERKAQQKAAKKAAGQKKGGKRAQSGK